LAALAGIDQALFVLVLPLLAAVACFAGLESQD
jgi:hypothetical protein